MTVVAAGERWLTNHELTVSSTVARSIFCFTSARMRKKVPAPTTGRTTALLPLTSLSGLPLIRLIGLVLGLPNTSELAFPIRRSRLCPCGCRLS